MAERGQTVESIFHLVSQDQAANQVAIGNCFGSLRLLGATDWRQFVEALSSVECILRDDPSGVYPHMDFATRDRYRLAVEEAAKVSPTSEEGVARAAVELSRDAVAVTERGARSRHVGHFLIGEGRLQLERHVRTRRGPVLAAIQLVRRFRVTVYAGAVALGTAALTAVLSLGARRLGFDHWALAGLTLVGAIAASQLAIGIVHWAFTLLVRPRSLPRLDFSTGIPADQQTVVAVPILLTDLVEIDHVLESLEVRFLANRDPHLDLAQ
jgi:hypothetical protein